MEYMDSLAATEARLKARKLFEDGKENSAVRILKRVLKDYPEDSITYEQLGTYYMKNNKWKEASKILIKAVKKDIGNSSILGNLGFCFYQLGEIQSACIYQQEALKLDEGNPILISNVVKMLFNSGELVEARKLIEKALEEYPNERAHYETANWLNIAECKITEENDTDQFYIDS